MSSLFKRDPSSSVDSIVAMYNANEWLKQRLNKTAAEKEELEKQVKFLTALIRSEDLAQNAASAQKGSRTFDRGNGVGPFNDDFAGARILNESNELLKDRRDSESACSRPQDVGHRLSKSREIGVASIQRDIKVDEGVIGRLVVARQESGGANDHGYELTDIPSSVRDIDNLMTPQQVADNDDSVGGCSREADDITMPSFLSANLHRALALLRLQQQQLEDLNLVVTEQKHTLRGLLTIPHICQKCLVSTVVHTNIEHSKATPDLTNPGETEKLGVQCTSNPEPEPVAVQSLNIEYMSRGKLSSSSERLQNGCAFAAETKQCGKFSDQGLQLSFPKDTETKATDFVYPTPKQVNKTSQDHILARRDSDVTRLSELEGIYRETQAVEESNPDNSDRDPSRCTNIVAEGHFSNSLFVSQDLNCTKAGDIAGENRGDISSSQNRSVNSGLNLKKEFNTENKDSNLSSIPSTLKEPDMSRQHVTQDKDATLVKSIPSSHVTNAINSSPAVLRGPITTTCSPATLVYEPITTDRSSAVDRGPVVTDHSSVIVPGSIVNSSSPAVLRGPITTTSSPANNIAMEINSGGHVWSEPSVDYRQRELASFPLDDEATTLMYIPSGIRVCPFCLKTVGAEVSQTEFERHVDDHFPADNIVNQFEMVHRD